MSLNSGKNILKSRKIIFSFVFLAIAAPIAYLSVSNTSTELDFNTEIRPIINKNCITCHGGVKRAGGFSLLFRSEALQKNESGKVAIIPGNPDESEFIKRLTHHDKKLRMPLNSPPLKKEEIEKLRTWIKQGAKWADHWAYVKPKPIEVPSTSSSWPKNGIDNFILDKLEKEGLTHSEEADRYTLIRRVTLDLTGLPPTKAEADAFINDKSPNAYENLVDRLLKSPAYGERWAAMWLDLARFADSKGYQTDGARNIWLYRDWVINAFNEDKPFDQFTVEQLAGDLIPNPKPSQIVATAFHRNTLNNEEGGTDDEEFRVAAVIDRVNTTWEVWQGTTISCVQCHSHPYDPFKHKEYYQFMSFFNNTADADRNDEYPTISVVPKEKEAELNKILSWVVFYDNIPDHVKYPQLSVAERKKAYPRMLPAAKADIIKGAKIKKHDILGFIEHKGYLKYKNIDLTDIDRISYGYGSGGGGLIAVHLDSIKGETVSFANLDYTGDWEIYQISSSNMKPVKGKHDIYFEFLSKNSNNQLYDLNWIELHHKNSSEKINLVKTNSEKVDMALRNIFSSSDNVPVMEELPSKMARKTHVFIRGNWLVKGDEVKSAVPGSMNPLPKGAPANRLGMAQWLVNPENPLTGRVIVNRFWEQLFGTGIVETLEDFGTQGMKPSHPELLDWLSLQFMNEYKWSMKTLLKTMVMSSTYRQSSKVSKEHIDKDLRNRYLSRGPRIRLTAEQVRDQALAVSGLLSKKMFGPSVYPPQPEGIWNNPNGGISWMLSPGEDRYRRALYTFVRRSSPYPSMMTFDAPGRTVCMSRRIRTNTPLQSLVTLNDTVYVEAARMMAEKMIKAGGSELNQLKTGYELALLHPPQQKTLDALTDLYKYSLNYYSNRPDDAKKMAIKGGTRNLGKTDTEIASMTVVANAILNLDEFITKE